MSAAEGRRREDAASGPRGVVGRAAGGGAGAVAAPGGGDVACRFVHEVEVRFRDLDPMGHAHHTLPLVYFEEARAAYWREVVGRPGLEDVDYAIGEVALRYHARVRWPGRLRIGVRVSRLGEKSFAMEYEARSGEGETLVTGRTVQVMFDYATGRSKPIPPEVRRRIEAFEGGGAR